MMIDDEEEAGLLIDFEHELTMIRLIENTFVPSNIKIRAEVLPTDTYDEDDFEIALTKMRFWLETIISRSIAFRRGNESAMKMLIDENGKNNSNNLLMLTPFEPNDEHIAALLQAKLSAFGCGVMIIGSVEIRTNNMQGLVFRFIGSADDVLPDMDSWIGEYSYFEDPWWHRDDASTLDVIPPPDTDLTVKPSWAYNLDFLSQAMKPQEVVLRPEFNPEVIDGGKDDGKDDE